MRLIAEGGKEMKLQVVCNKCFKNLKIDGGYTNLNESILTMPIIIKHKCSDKEDKKWRQKE